MWHRTKAPSVLPEELSQGATVPSLCSRTAPEVVEGAGEGEEEEHVCTEPPGWWAGLSTPGFIAWVVPALLLGFSLPGHGRGMGYSHPAPGGPEGSSKDALYQSREGEPWVLLAAGMPRENASG